MLVKSDGLTEKGIIEEMTRDDEELHGQHELFEAEMAFKQELIDARKRDKNQMLVGQGGQRR